METKAETEQEIAAMAARLSPTQTAYLTHRAEWRKPAFWAQERWMTFPPMNVHRVLIRLGLVDRSGQLLVLGLALRAHLSKDQPQ